MKVIRYFAFMFAVSGCATSSVNDYSELESKFSVQKPVAIQEAIDKGRAIVIQQDKLERVTLSKDEPLFKFGEYLSYYTFLSFKTDAGKAYKIDLWSVCDCVGFSKTLVDPILQIYASDKSPIKAKLTTSLVEDVNWQIKRPLSLHNTYEFVAPDSQIVLITLAANNQNVGGTLSLRSADAYAPGVVMHIPVKIMTRPTGLFEISVSTAVVN